MNTEAVPAIVQVKNTLHHLAIGDNTLLGNYYRNDPLGCYKGHLDDRQRAIVDQARGW